MRILVTGSSGFIGSALVPELARRGHDVVQGRRAEADLARDLEGCDAVVHLANLAHARAGADELRRVNVEGTRKLAVLAGARGVRRFVYLSSIKASGEETRGRPFDGRETPAPADAYGEAKLAAEAALAEAARESGIERVVLRPPLVYGPGVKANFRALLDALRRGWPLPLAGIDNRRSLVYVGNLADCIARCVESRPVRDRTYVVSDGEALSTPALCRRIAAALGVPARLFPFPQAMLELAAPLRALTRSLEVDDTALRTELGWRPPFGVDQGLRATVSSA